MCEEDEMEDEDLCEGENEAILDTSFVGEDIFRVDDLGDIIFPADTFDADIFAGDS
jgi:hypothetical protein